MMRRLNHPLVHLAGFILFLAAIGWVIHKFGLIDSAAEFQQRIEATGAWSGLLYPLLYAACNLLLLPAGILGVGAGFFFGLWWGFVIVLTGNLLGAAIAITLARTIGRRWVQRQVARRPRLAALDHAIARDARRIIILSQLHPLFPTSLLNYLYGVTRVPLRKCIGWIAIGQAPGLFLYSYLGTLGQLSLGMARGQTEPGTHEFLLWGGGLFASLAITALLGQVAIRILKEVLAREPKGSAGLSKSATHRLGT